MPKEPGTPFFITPDGFSPSEERYLNMIVSALSKAEPYSTVKIFMRFFMADMPTPVRTLRVIFDRHNSVKKWRAAGVSVRNLDPAGLFILPSELRAYWRSLDEKRASDGKN